jgi:beta-aspartyl-peptidase (threonine type)
VKKISANPRHKPLPWLGSILIVTLMTIVPAIAIAAESAPFALAIHGGAGVGDKKNLSPAKEAACRATLEAALRAGHAILQTNGAGMDAVIAAIKVLEDSPLFNAGKGAVLTSEGKAELDASIMDGATLKAGAVAGVTHIKNPIELARLVMEKSPHVLLAGDGAEKFAQQQGVRLVRQSYFITKERREQLERTKKQAGGKQASLEHASDIDFIGTVGAVALDRRGNLAAGTSTGGMVNKKFGRIGDSPIIGAGTYADNAVCAVSCTGHGEYFIRSVVAYDIAALMKYKKSSLGAAADEVVMKKLVALGGRGGVIAIDPLGNIAMPFNSDGMFRGFIRIDGKPVVAVYDK